MNWFSKLFSSKNQASATRPASAKGAAGSGSNATVIVASPPIAIDETALPIETLKKFAPLRNLDNDSIATLPHHTARYAENAVIFTRHQQTNSVFYLLEGRVHIQPDSENSYEVDAAGSQSSLPLNSGNVCGSTAIALTPVKILKVSVELNRLWANRSNEDFACVELVDIELPSAISNNRFFSSFAQAYRENKLRLPSLPNVAFKLKEAMQHEIGINEAVDIIHIDPPIVAKLIQVANSPLYATAAPITNCHEAVKRIGLNATRSLVMGISLKQLFHCKDPDLMKGMQNLWKNSLYVSSLSFILAQECSNQINPEDALLAGLVCDIGAIPLLHFAEQFPEHYPSFDELQASMPFLRAPVGALMLHTLGFPEQLVNIPHQAENWLYDSGEQLSLIDIVILAKLHSYFGSKNARNLPHINSIPAYSKLNQGQLDPDFSLGILQKAQHRIHAAMQMLS